MHPRAILRNDAVLAAAVACVAFATFAPALGGGFVHDDHRQIVGNPLLQALGGWPALWTSGVWAGAGSGSSWYRPLMMQSFALDRALFGAGALGAHAISLALFGAVAALVFRIARMAGSSVAVALAAALLGAVHPVQAEVSAWISARCELLVAAFGIVALGLHDRALRRRASHGGVGLAFLLALASKESAVVFVPLFFALDRLRGAPWSARETARRHAPWLFAVGLYASARAHALGGVSGGIVGAVDPRALLAFFGQGAARIVAPFALTISPPEPGMASAWIGAGCAIAGAIALSVAWQRRSASMLPLGMGLGFLTIGALGAARLGEVADRYLLLPVFAATWLVATGVAALPVRAQRTGWLATAVVGVLFAVSASSHVRVYRDDEALWSDAHAKNPSAVRPVLNLGALYLDRGEPRRALEWLDRAAALAPADPQVELDRAVAFEQLGDAVGARARLDALADANPGFWPAALRAGHLALDARDWSAAAMRYEDVLRAHPLSAEAWAGLGVVRERQGRRDAAREAIERSLALDPVQDNAAALRAMLARLRS